MYIYTHTHTYIYTHTNEYILKFSIHYTAKKDWAPKTQPVTPLMFTKVPT